MTEADVQHCRGIAKRICSRLGFTRLIDDASQMACIAFWRGELSFDASRGPTSYQYLHRRIHGAVIDYIRAETDVRNVHRAEFVLLVDCDRENSSGEVIETERIPPVQPYGTTGIEYAEQRDAVQSLIAQIRNERWKEIIYLRYYAGWAWWRISERLGVNETRAQAIHRSAIERMRELSGIGLSTRETQRRRYESEKKRAYWRRKQQSLCQSHV